MAQSATPNDLPNDVAMGSSCSDTLSPIVEIARLMRSITAAACSESMTRRLLVSPRGVEDPEQMTLLKNLLRAILLTKSIQSRSQYETPGQMLC